MDMRLQLLLEQFDWAREIAQARLDGNVSPASLPEGVPLTPRKGSGRLTDEEYLWEPVPGSWSVRRRAEAASPQPFGAGEWVMDRAHGDLDPPPITTIAWRLSHLYADFTSSWEWTFGERRPVDQIDFTPSADLALQRLWTAVDRWRSSVATVTPEQLDTVGFNQQPNSSAPEEPYVDTLWFTNLEFIHHMAEIALLRDLWQHRAA